MSMRTIGALVLVAMALASACSTVQGYPPEWHAATNSIHVYGSIPAKTIGLPASGEPVTLLDVVLGLGETGSDLTRVVVFRRSGSEMIRLDVDVRAMLLTGQTTQNIMLQPGDVVGIVG